jgi:hypothetical protein
MLRIYINKNHKQGKKIARQSQDNFKQIFEDCGKSVDNLDRSVIYNMDE